MDFLNFQNGLRKNAFDPQHDATGTEAVTIHTLVTPELSLRYE